MTVKASVTGVLSYRMRYRYAESTCCFSCRPATRQWAGVLHQVGNNECQSDVSKLIRRPAVNSTTTTRHSAKHYCFAVFMSSIAFKRLHSYMEIV